MTFCLPSAEFHYFGFAACKITPKCCLIWWHSISAKAPEGHRAVIKCYPVIVALVHLFSFFFNPPTHPHTHPYRNISKCNRFLWEMCSAYFKVWSVVYLLCRIYNADFLLYLPSIYVAVHDIVYLCCFLFACSGQAVDLLNLSRTEHEII